MADPKEKNGTQASRPMGRPSKYSPHYCDEVVAAMGEGLSLTAFAGMIGVSKDTVYEWIKEHPDFSDAVSRARPKRLMYLERRFLDAETGARASTHQFALKNADRDEWRDKQDVEHSGSVASEPSYDLSGFSDEELRAFRDLLAKARRK